MFRLTEVVLDLPGMPVKRSYCEYLWMQFVEFNDRWMHGSTADRVVLTTVGKSRIVTLYVKFIIDTLANIRQTSKHWNF